MQREDSEIGLPNICHHSPITKEVPILFGPMYLAKNLNFLGFIPASGDHVLILGQDFWGNHLPSEQKGKDVPGTLFSPFSLVFGAWNKDVMPGGTAAILWA